MFVNAGLILFNKRVPIYYGLISFVIALVFLAGLILIAIWACKDYAGSRTCLITGSWLILGATIGLIFWNLLFLYVFDKKHKDNIWVGSGDDPDDYTEESKGKYMVGYVVGGLIILTFDILLILVA